WQPEIVFHLAAQPIVGLSYKNPRETFETNIMGTVNLMECIKKSASVKAAIIVTSDKCYDNKEWLWGYRENDSLGGFDPYSSSKACCELVTSAYRNSFFTAADNAPSNVGIASVRAGNVIGGGDWSPGRIIPDCIRALLKNEKIVVRNPYAVRPWQHVLEPLSGYLALAERLIESPAAYSEAWNFGPDENGCIQVEQLVKRLCEKWNPKGNYFICEENYPHEANMLKLDCSKAKSRLCWTPKWDIEKSLDKVIEWNRSLQESQDMYEVCLKQIDEYALN
ncbi:MAG TPA: CDP-glucose 4,6-dehydratase, partial [Clostridia bacterium]|nr:CDP-glucose 4,6-dehydratase [Clostridia bacterium]